jgi:uncharacterized membrane protein YbjE (DUF340 family)
VPSAPEHEVQHRSRFLIGFDVRASEAVRRHHALRRDAGLVAAMTIAMALVVGVLAALGMRS